MSISRPIPPQVRRAVHLRDKECVARLIDPKAGRCSGILTLDHVKSSPAMSLSAPSDVAHLVVLCWRHHLETGWATSHRPELREYLRTVNETEDVG